MFRLGRIRISDTGRALTLLAALALILLVHVSATLAAGPLAGPPRLRLERDLAALRVQLDTLPERFIETALGELSFNTAIGNGDPEHRWQTLIAMTHSAQRGAGDLRQSFRQAGAGERADLALLIGVQLSNVQQAVSTWRQAESASGAKAAVQRALEALDRADAVLATLDLEGPSPQLADPSAAHQVEATPIDG